jgi:hypothetical protein
MKTKLVLWGTNAQDERVLIALELRPKDNKVDVYTFPESVATEEFSQKMMNDWRNDTPLDFPEGFSKSERELTITESLLPEDLKVERSDVILRAQTEWAFVVLSTKLSEAYQHELAEFKERVEKLESFDDELWAGLKNFWDKVQVQVRERNLFREHADMLRDHTNALFTRMKEMRNKLDEDFQRKSKDNMARFFGTLEEIEGKIKEGLRLQPLFDKLKELQREFRDAEFTREHRSKVWERLDAAFKSAKGQREESAGSGGGGEASPGERLQRRFDGLVSAIDKMEQSIRRDREELDFQNRRIASTDGQLEAQIRQAKIKMIEERIRSKEEKLHEMNTTRVDLEKRLAQQRDRDAKRAERDKLEEAKKHAQEKIAQEIKAAAVAREAEEEKLAKAAEAISSEKGKKKPKKDSLLGAISTTLGETLGDAVDTVKAVAEVVGDKVEEAVENAVEDIKEAWQEAKEAVAEAQEEETVAGTAVEEPVAEAEAAEETPVEEPIAEAVAETPAEEAPAATEPAEEAPAAPAEEEKPE